MRDRDVQAPTNHQPADPDETKSDMAPQYEPISRQQTGDERARHEGARQQQRAAAPQPFPPIQELELGQILRTPAGGEDRILLVQLEGRGPGLVVERGKQIDGRSDGEQAGCQPVLDAQHQRGEAECRKDQEIKLHRAHISARRLSRCHHR